MARFKGTMRLCRQILGLVMSPTDELVVVEVAGNEPEAELLCSLLRSAGIACLSRLTSRGAGAGDGLGIAGPHEIMVKSQDAEAAREILRQA
jgi:hypothetical protein